MKRLVAFFVLLSLSATLSAQPTPARRIYNAHEIYRELAIDPASVGKVKDYFPGFFDYQDMVMFHPKFGYYSSGRVSFTSDYQTFPIVLAPAFGNMIAEQLFQMWSGMRQAGTLTDKEKFTIGEVGAGNGALAESILDYIRTQAATRPQSQWPAFAKQAVYVCYDRSPALNEEQRKRNQRFGDGFDARVADATDFTATIKPGSLKGVILSNELPDAFSVHKVILTTSHAPEVAYVAPSMSAASWRNVKKMISPALATQVEEGDVGIEKIFFKGAPSAEVYLTKGTFSTLLETTVTQKDYESVVGALEFHEIYVPASNIPELSSHLRRHAKAYADLLVRNNDGVLTYINPGVEKMIQGSAQILAAGYVITIDYGSSWNGILSNDGTQHFRTFGPAHRAASAQTNAAVDASVDQIQTSDPYDRPTLNDLTTDVNFSLLDVEGREAGLRTLFYGSQKALQSGTPISLDKAPERAVRDNVAGQFLSWAADFRAPSVYKVMIQQKAGTDAKYRYPDDDPEPLELSTTPLTRTQQDLAAAIVKRLSGQ